MDSDPWVSRLAAAKRHYLLQQQQSSYSDRFDVDEYELEEEVRSDFPCPFCDEDHDIASLCSHLEDEHPFESKAAVCPVCSVKVAGEMLSHIMLQHGQAFKLQRHRRLRRVAIPNGQALSLLGKDLREAHLQALLGGGAYRSSNSSTSAAAADSFLSSFALNFPASEAEETSKSSLSHVDDFIGKKSTTKAGNPSIDLSLSQEEREKKQRQATVRAKFVQDLLLSTLFDD
ncbi:protein DEHYDRATION-INDUCED 19 isoform X2 [Dendrobium catenatum]|uniref:Protein DEHYDRATION-INDUCED 19 n=1 Tax=Dendrobium catenatum TaxID=906689 RepID=A0A2I0V9L9_9ASPA|nr:protein DEHYDRATION-INDUCED 19 isoform X2 [Dendrobium catenatum]PKU60103.1 Protein DEHYDRATION-INDUCED 19 [Dendrobium catenatum]